VILLGSASQQKSPKTPCGSFLFVWLPAPAHAKCMAAALEAKHKLLAGVWIIVENYFVILFGGASQQNHPKLPVAVFFLFGFLHRLMRNAWPLRWKPNINSLQECGLSSRITA
jgi:hypothetical protein